MPGKVQEEHNENVPLQALPSSTVKDVDTRNSKGGWFVSKTKIALFAVLIVILVIVIIVLAVLFGIAKAGKHEGMF
jgi:t-SNARE complex subunit (syntaxin)